VTLVGIGYDCHRLVEGRPLVLGGVQIEHDRGLEGHSDADVLAHAVTDALLGAAGMGDIGQHFPDTDERWRGADSLELLRAVVGLLSERELGPVNVDCTVIIEAPPISPHRERIRARLAEALGLEHARVNVKATTSEGMGFIGSREGAAALAVATVAQAAGGRSGERGRGR
jgi:2-C-methyl-D-erythritol 2,4-cyclodiphosphate synthase